MDGVIEPGEHEDDSDDEREPWCWCLDRETCPGYHPTLSELRRMCARDDGYDPVTPEEEESWTR